MAFVVWLFGYLVVWLVVLWLGSPLLKGQSVTLHHILMARSRAVLKGRHRLHDANHDVLVVASNQVVRSNAHLLGHEPDVRLCIVLAGRSEARDDRPNRVAAMLHPIRPQQAECSAETPRHRLELAELIVRLSWIKTKPSVVSMTDIKGIVVAVASFHVLGFKVIRLLGCEVILVVGEEWGWQLITNQPHYQLSPRA